MYAYLYMYTYKPVCIFRCDTRSQFSISLFLSPFQHFHTISLTSASRCATKFQLFWAFTSSRWALPLLRTRAPRKNRKRQHSTQLQATVAINFCRAPQNRRLWKKGFIIYIYICKGAPAAHAAGRRKQKRSRKIYTNKFQNSGISIGA